MLPRIEILMATYNGIAFLPKQLDSLIGQAHRNWRLTVHDDGSTDGTRELIGRYQRKDERIVLLDDRVTGLGAAANYLHLMRQVDGEYYMFCDQDDIWFASKIAKMAHAIADCVGPAAVYSDAYLYPIKGGTGQKSTVIHPSSVRNTLFFNSGIQGCAMIFNRQLMDILRPFPDKVAMHDHLVTMGAVAFGNLIHLDEVLMYYRQHESNATGNQEIGALKKVFSFFSPSKPVIDRMHFDANIFFYKRYCDLLDNRTKERFQAYFQYASNRSLFRRLLILLQNGFTLGDRRCVLFIKTLIRKPIG